MYPAHRATHLCFRLHALLFNSVHHLTRLLPLLVVFHPAGNVNMMLPNVWLWNMVDEFLYQFQSFAQYRSKLTTKSPEEIELLKKCDKVGVRVCWWMCF